MVAPPHAPSYAPRSMLARLPLPGARCGALALVLVGVLPACDPNLPPALEVGTGEINFVPLEDGDTLEIIQGPQGGFHLLTSLRVHGIAPGDRGDLTEPTNPTLTLDVTGEAGDSWIAIGPITQGLDASPLSERPFTHQMTGRFAILDILADDELAGQSVDLSVHIAADGDIEVSGSVHIDLVPHPDNL